MFEWLIQTEVFENLLTELDMLNHHYSDSSVEFVSNVIYSFLQTVMSQDVKFYLQYVILRKNHRLRTMIFSKPLRHRWNEATSRKRYLHKSLPNLIHNRHEDRLLTMINFSKQDATNCTKFCEKLSRNFNKWMKRLMQQDQTIDDVPLQIISDNLTKKNFLKFDADWISELMKKKNICFAFSKVPRRVIGGNLNMKMIIYVAYRCLQNDKKIFEESETEIRNDISKLYRNFALPSYFSVEFSAELFNFNRCFLIMMKTSIFSAIEDVIVDRRI